MSPPRKLAALVFDVGETLIDETRTWEVVADAVGVPRFTFMATLGGLIAAGRSHREIFDRFGVSEPATLPALQPDDVYPDARSCLVALRALGFRVGIAANQPDRAAEIQRVIGVELDFVATSAAWGVAKPSPAFFERIAAELGLPPEAIAYDAGPGAGPYIAGTLLAIRRVGSVTGLMRGLDHLL